MQQPDAQLALGICYELGDGVTKDVAHAVRLYRQAVAQGHAPAQLRLCDLYRAGLDDAVPSQTRLAGHLRQLPTSPPAR